MAMRWRWPPDSLTPRSPTMVRSLRQGLDEVAARRDRRCQHLVVGGVRPAVADVLHDRAVKQRDVLRHDGDGLAQALLRDARDVLAVDQDAAALQIVEALQQGEQRRLAAAGMADQADALARPEVQIEIPEDPLAVAVAEIDMLELDAARRA